MKYEFQYYDDDGLDEMRLHNFSHTFYYNYNTQYVIGGGSLYVPSCRLYVGTRIITEYQFTVKNSQVNKTLLSNTNQLFRFVQKFSPNVFVDSLTSGGARTEISFFSKEIFILFNRNICHHSILEHFDNHLKMIPTL